MCPDRDILSAWMDGELEAPWSRAVEEHLAACAQCRERLAVLERTRALLRADPEPDLAAPMERVRQSVLAQGLAQPSPVARFWQRKVALPVPLAAAAVLLVMLLAGALVLALAQGSFGLIAISRPPAGGTEIRIAAPINDLNTLLGSLNQQAAFREDVIKLPKDVVLTPIGQPRMGKEQEFIRRSGR
jgi:anti-sigma factor RsiW